MKKKRRIFSYERYSIELIPFIKELTTFKSFSVDKIIFENNMNIPISCVSYILRVLERNGHIKQIGKEGRVIIWKTIQ